MVLLNILGHQLKIVGHEKDLEVIIVCELNYIRYMHISQARDLRKGQQGKHGVRNKKFVPVCAYTKHVRPPLYKSGYLGAGPFKLLQSRFCSWTAHDRAYICMRGVGASGGGRNFGFNTNHMCVHTCVNVPSMTLLIKLNPGLKELRMKIARKKIHQLAEGCEDT